jgi:hypothetical protein
MASIGRAQLGSALAATALLAGSLAMGSLAERRYDEQMTLEQQLLRSEAAARTALQRAQDSLELSRRVSQRFAELRDAGLFEAIDKPRAIDRAEARLRPYFGAIARYQIGGSHEVVPAPLPAVSRYQIDIERVAVDFEPLHEERFLDVWSAIAALRGPVGSVESCKLDRPAAEVAASAGGAGGMPPLKARCLLTWYRLQSAPPASAAGGAPAPAAPRSDS